MSCCCKYFVFVYICFMLHSCAINLRIMQHICHMLQLATTLHLRCALSCALCFLLFLAFLFSYNLHFFYLFLCFSDCFHHTLAPGLCVVDILKKFHFNMPSVGIRSLLMTLLGANIFEN